jgi:ribonuclease G
MTELLIQKNDEKKQIALVENGKLIEYYEEDENTHRREGNIYIGIVKDIIKGMQSAFVDIGTEKNSFIHLKDILPKIDQTKEEQNSNIDISDMIQPNQKILVQVKKDSNEKKGARVSTHINLPSKYIVLMPNTDIITISQKIEDETEQKRLIKLVKDNLSKGNGAIIRTSAQGKGEEIIEDIKQIEDKWNKIIQTSINPKLNKAKLLYKSENIIEKILMDLTEKEIKIIEEKDAFYKYDINKQIEKVQNRKIWLKCGGFITIDKTEALTAIDVNTGKYTGNKSLEQTVFKVNREATIEIAKQLRLRDIGGIIIIDYIDMKSQEDREAIEKLLKEELKKDRTKTQVEGFTKLDLMEMTRKHICSHKE